MKAPVGWLREHVDIADLSPRELAGKLTAAGIEVEGIEEQGAALDDHFVVGEVLACEPHPGAEHLRVCKVADGTRELQVVCGAPDCAAGLKVPLARSGAVLPESGAVIRRARLRGVESCGMLCSERELKISSDHAGLMILDPALAPGTPLREVLPPPETVLDLEITWNRPDCLSIIGIARELAAMLRRPLRLPPAEFTVAGEPAGRLATVRVAEPRLCPRYTALVLAGVRDGPSPLWMRRRLEQCGVRPLGLIVDVTNYVMLECGQPLHAFDLRRLAGRTIIVRRARTGERIRTLDGVERLLDEEMLVIADAREPVAVAGVMGGAGSEIAPGADSVLLESALFAAPSVKRTATALGLRTESSFRFERGVDPGLADWAGRRAASLLARLGGARVAPGLIDIDNRPPPPPPVRLRHRRCQEVIGLPLTADAMREILLALGLRVTAEEPAATTFAVPSWRGDLLREADLIEEVARLHGLDRLPEILPAAIAVPGADDAPARAEALCRQTLLGFGLNEAMHYSFLAAAELDAFDPAGAPARLTLPNPVSADFAVMRDSLLLQLTAALGRNHARQIEAPALFEIGRVFGRDAADGSPHEETRLAMGFCGPFGRQTIDRRRPVGNEEALLWLKGLIEALLARLHAGEPTLTPAACSAFEPGWSAEIALDGAAIGRLGLVRAALRHPWRLHAPMAVAEMRLAPLLAHVGSLAPLRPVPAYPAVRRDLALVVPPEVTHAGIVQAIRAVAPGELTDIRLFDMFVPEELRGVRRCLAYSLEFRSAERTLTDDEVNKACREIIAAVKESLGVEVREG